ncbi:MAG: DUF2520 domain-containing protein [Caldilineales bacterium]|nr:DUF2520 domain-containing protein [Caldilineales bacterium]
MAFFLPTSQMMSAATPTMLSQTGLPAKPVLGLIGAGRAGGALALAAHDAGYRLTVIHTRTPDRARPLLAATGAELAASLAAVIGAADLVIIAVPDDAIADVDEAGAGLWRPGQGVIHLSGIHPASILQHVPAAGGLTGALHPLQSFSDAESGRALMAGTYFGISGHPGLIPILEQLVQALGGHSLVVSDEAKVLYHAAAVFAANYVSVCFAQAVRILGGIGIPEPEATPALLALTRGAVANLDYPGLPLALTGPISRGDAGTLRNHQEHLAASQPDLLPLYQLLGQAALPIAAAQGRLNPTEIEAMRLVLTS